MTLTKPLDVKESNCAVSWSGYVDGLFFAPRSMLPMRSMPQLRILEGKGVEGDRYAMGRGHLTEKLASLGLTEQRHVSLFDQETVDALERDHQIVLGPGEHRRNVTTIGVPLGQLVGKRFRVGEVILEGAYFPPCKHLEDVIGAPVAPLLIKRCGLFGRILRGGIIHVGDPIEPL